MRISLIHASYKSIQQSKAVRDYWLRMASNRESIEHCLGFEFDDHETRQGYSIPDGKSMGETSDRLTRFLTTPVTSGVSAVANWNAAASIATGDLLLVIADDLIPEKNWDQSILRILAGCDLSIPLILKFTDFRCSDLQNYPLGDIYLPRHPMVNRAFFQERGYFFCPEFYGIGADDHLLLEGISKGIIRDLRSIKFHHSVGQILNEAGYPTCGCAGNQSSGMKTDSQNAIHREKIDTLSVFSKRYSREQLFKYQLSCHPKLLSTIRRRASTQFGFGEEIEFKSSLWLLLVASVYKALRIVLN
jgi:hypothetical protein